MGKQFWVGVFLLLLLLGLTLGVAWGMEAIQEPAQKQLEQASVLALSGDMPQAAELAMQAKQRWERFWQVSAAVADHSPMDEIDKVFAEMEVYAKAGDEEHFAACCAQLSQLVGSMSDAHAHTWWNFL